MKTMKNYIKYQGCTYFKSSKGLTPLFVCMILVVFFFSGVDFSIESFSISLVINFILAGYASLMFFREDEVEEQILYLQIKNKNIYYWGKLLFMFLICSLYGTLTMLFICTRYVLFFHIPISVLISIYSLHILSAWCGCIVLAFLHPKLYKAQKNVSVVALLIILIYLLLPFIKTIYPVVGCVSWIVAPIANSLDGINHGDSFDILICLRSVLVLAVYGFVYAIVFIGVIKRKRFS